MSKKENFFEAEYKESTLSPVKLKINGKEFTVPLFYLLHNSDEKSAKSEFLDDFFDAEIKDFDMYRKKGIEARNISWFDGHATYEFHVPYVLRNKKIPNSEVITFIFNRAEKKYNRAASLAKKLRKANPNKVGFYNVKTAAVKTMREEYNAYLWAKTKDNVRYMALKTEDILSDAYYFSKNTLSKIDKRDLKIFAHKYALRALIGASALTSGVKINQYLNSLENEKKTEKTIAEAKSDSLKTEAQSENIDTKIKPEKKKTETKEQVQNPIKEEVREAASRGVALSASINPKSMSLSQTIAHNEKCFNENINEIKVLLCFMENFASKAFDDDKGVWTIGYGCTFLIDEKGRGNRDISPITPNMTMTMEEANIQKDRYLKFRVLPQIKKDIKVPLTKEEITAISSFAYVIGPDNFKNSEFLKALNKGVKGEQLARYMLGFAKDQGVVKRNLFAFYVMTGKMTPKDFLNLRTEGCYTLEMDDCCFMNGDNLKRDAKGLGTFRKDNLKENIETAKKPRYSKIGKCLLVKEVLPKSVINKVKSNSLKNSQEAQKIIMAQKSKSR